MSMTRISVTELGDQVHLGADEVLVGRPPPTGPGTRPRSAGRLIDLGVDELGRLRAANPSGQGIELEVHPARTAVPCCRR